jgi:hypothetical protein
MINNDDAISSLRPDSEWVRRGEELEWLDTTQTQPTDAEITAEITRLQAEYDATQYQRDRQTEYPSINDLIVALWENVVEERASAVVSLEAKRQAVKTKYPKP